MTRREALRKAVVALTPKQRFVIEQSWGLDGREPLSFYQVGELMGVTETAARKLYTNGMKRLAQKVRSYPLSVEGEYAQTSFDFYRGLMEGQDGVYENRTGQILSGQIPYSEMASWEQASVDEWLYGSGPLADDYSEDSFS